MTNQQERHLQSIKANFSALVDEKYRAGQKEHGGDLFAKTPKQLINMALDEAIDQVVYLLTLRSVVYGVYPDD